MSERTYTEAEVKTIIAPLEEKLKQYEEQIQEQTNLFSKRETELKRWRIAMQVGLPLELADRIVGETETEIYADAYSMVYTMGKDANAPSGKFFNLSILEQEAVANSKIPKSPSHKVLEDVKKNLPANKRSVGGWKAFQEFYKHVDIGGTIMVNNISVRDPDFVKKVMGSVKDTDTPHWSGKYIVNFEPGK